MATSSADAPTPTIAMTISVRYHPASHAVMARTTVIASKASTGANTTKSRPRAPTPAGFDPWSGNTLIASENAIKLPCSASVSPLYVCLHGTAPTPGIVARCDAFDSGQASAGAHCGNPANIDPLAQP